MFRLVQDCQTWMAHANIFPSPSSWVCLIGIARDSTEGFYNSIKSHTRVLLHITRFWALTYFHPNWLAFLRAEFESKDDIHGGHILALPWIWEICINESLGKLRLIKHNRWRKEPMRKEQEAVSFLRWFCLLVLARVAPWGSSDHHCGRHHLPCWRHSASTLELAGLFFLPVCGGSGDFKGCHKENTHEERAGLLLFLGRSGPDGKFPEEHCHNQTGFTINKRNVVRRALEDPPSQVLSAKAFTVGGLI